MSNPIKVFFLDQFDTTSAYYRIYIVNNELLKQRLAYSTVANAVANNLTFKTKDDFKNYFLTYLIKSDIVVAQAPAKLEALPLYVLAKELKKPFIIEVDDLVDRLHGGFSQDRILEHERLWNIRKDLWALADGFICSTGYLANHYSRMFGKPAWVFDNYIDFDDRRWDVARIDTGKTIIGYMGGDSHADDIKIIEPVIEHIIDSYDDVDFQFLYFMPDYLKQKYRGNPRVRFIPSDGTINNYTPMMAQFDIGLIPLEDNDFNKAKSDLKYLEYSRLGIASVVSKVGVYKCVENNINGLVVRNKTDDWLGAVCKLIENTDLRKGLSENAFDYVKYKRNIKLNAYKYKEILERVNAAQRNKQKAAL
jgi:glycosyltransferase involved in cell wall biosynthesis